MAQLNPVAFDRHLNGIGQSFLWRKSYACPCVNPGTYQANPNCQICAGKGRIWGDEVPASAGVAHTSVQQSWARMGQYESGDTVLSIPGSSPLYGADQYDRILNLNAIDQFSMAIVPAKLGNRILSRIIKITRVFWVTPDLTTIVEGGIPAFDINGFLTWPNGGAPPAGVTYSVTGTRLLEFFVFKDLASPRNEHHGAALPRKLVARSFDIYAR